MKKDRFEIRLAQRYVNQFESGLCGILKQACNLDRMRDRELRNAIGSLAAVRRNPGDDAIRRAAKMRQHLTARAECVVDKIVTRAERDDLAMIDNGDAIAQTLGFFHVVRRVDERHALSA